MPKLGERPLFRPFYNGNLRGGALLSPPLPQEKPRPTGVQFIDYPPHLPLPEDTADNTRGLTDWGVMANDRVGDCVLACIGHSLEAWTNLTVGIPTVLPDSVILQAYSAITGYNPSTGANDNGMTVVQGLEYWRANGLGGHKLVGFSRFRPSSLEGIRQSTDLFGVCILAMGINPGMIESFSTGQYWEGSYGPPTEYHCVPVIAYDDAHAECVTWGALQRMSWSFFNQYVVEAYVACGPEMVASGGATFAGYSQADSLIFLRKLITSGMIFKT